MKIRLWTNHIELHSGQQTDLISDEGDVYLPKFYYQTHASLGFVTASFRSIPKGCAIPVHEKAIVCWNHRPIIPPCGLGTIQNPNPRAPSTTTVQSEQEIKRNRAEEHKIRWRHTYIPRHSVLDKGTGVSWHLVVFTAAAYDFGRWNMLTIHGANERAREREGWRCNRIRLLFSFTVLSPRST